MKVLQEKVRDLELLFRMMLVRHEARVGSRHDSLLAGYHLEVARAGVAWSQGNLEATIDHICFAIRCCESLAEFRKSMARGGLSTYSSVSHAQSLLVNTELTLARLREHQQGIPFAPSLVDVIERTSLEATGKVGADEIAILRRMITELDNLTHLAAERYKSGMIGSGEYDSLARRLERTKADLAWTQGDPAGVRSHLEKALGHAQQAASVARAKLESGRIESEQGIQESALNYFAAKLDLVRLERTSDSDKN
jgi:hypothetical protein